MKILKIECCGTCPYLVVEDLSALTGKETYYCERTARCGLSEEETNKIPEWCPLENV
jgi:hypothetical protein